jgi:ParB-like chromosome segregation protein Spo0J
MAASDHLQGEQLAMFMPAHALMDYSSVENLRRLPMSAPTGLHDIKLKESQDSGLLESIRDRGVEEPVQVMVHKHHETSEDLHELLNGHHRVASANHINPNMEVPVRHISLKDRGY